MTGVGTIDLGTKQMGFRVEPKLVMTTEGQGRANEPVGFGIPVIIDGPWAQPRIYPEMNGILENPDQAYAKLKEMGKGLFGQNGGGLGAATQRLLGGASSNPAPAGQTPGPQPGALGGNLGDTLGNLLQQGLGGLAAAAASAGQPQGAAATNRSRKRAPRKPQAAASPPPAPTPEPQLPDARPRPGAPQQASQRLPRTSRRRTARR